MDNEDNAGLQRAIDLLQTVKAKADTDGISITRADLWALAGNYSPSFHSILYNWFYEEKSNQGQVGAEYGMPPGGRRQSFEATPFTYYTGRQDCSTSPYTTENFVFPSPRLTSASVYEYFLDGFGLSKEEVWKPIVY